MTPPRQGCDDAGRAPRSAPANPPVDAPPGVRQSGRRRSGGRQSRVARRSEEAPRAPAQIRRRVPCYELLDEQALQALEEQADWLLAEIGVEFPDDAESRELLRAAGASVSGSRVRFPPGLAKSLCASAPREFEMRARDYRYNIRIGGDNVVFAPSYGPPFVTDLEGGRRYATLGDFENIVKLSYAAPQLQHSGGTVCEPVDIPVNKRHLDMVYAHLRYSTKPFMGSVTAPQRAEDSIEMARIVFGDAWMERHCVIMGNVNVNSPLTFDGVMTGALKAYARANQGILLSPFILGGAMGPVTQPALIAQAHAEALVGIALSQLVRPGAPVIYGCFLSTVDLKSGAPTFGTAEANLAILAIGQLCRRLGLPLRCGGQMTAAKCADGQAMQESADGMLAGLQAGANFVLHAAGWLEGGLSFGYEKFAIDLDHCALLQRQLGGLQIDANGLGREAYREAGPGQSFFGVAHTLANFEDANLRSALADNDSFEQWQAGGSETIERRASRRWKQMLADYQPPPMDPAIDEALRDFIARRKAAEPDCWY